MTLLLLLLLFIITAQQHHSIKRNIWVHISDLAFHSNGWRTAAYSGDRGSRGQRARSVLLVGDVRLFIRPLSELQMTWCVWVVIIRRQRQRRCGWSETDVRKFGEFGECFYLAPFLRYSEILVENRRFQPTPPVFGPFGAPVGHHATGISSKSLASEN